MEKPAKPARAKTTRPRGTKSDATTSTKATPSGTRRAAKPTGEPTVTAKTPPRPRTRKKPGAAQTPSHDQISTRAYFLWEAAGRPDGSAEAFWHAAERELLSAR